MISRRSTFALTFAGLATLSVAMAAEVRHGDAAEARVPAAVATPVIYELPKVVVTGRVQRDTAAR